MQCISAIPNGFFLTVLIFRGNLLSNYAFGGEWEDIGPGGVLS